MPSTEIVVGGLDSTVICSGSELANPELNATCTQEIEVDDLQLDTNVADTLTGAEEGGTRTMDIAQRIETDVSVIETRLNDDGSTETEYALPAEECDTAEDLLNLVPNLTGRIETGDGRCSLVEPGVDQWFGEFFSRHEAGIVDMEATSAGRTSQSASHRLSTSDFLLRRFRRDIRTHSWLPGAVRPRRETIDATDDCDGKITGSPRNSLRTGMFRHTPRNQCCGHCRRIGYFPTNVQ